MVKFARCCRARSKADADAEDTGDGRAEDVEELWGHDYAERERRGHSNKNESDDDDPARKRGRIREIGRVSGV